MLLLQLLASGQRIQCVVRCVQAQHVIELAAGSRCTVLRASQL